MGRLHVKEKQKTDGYAIFGEDYRKIEKESNKLKGQVYYLVSGHGGPDPGAIGKKDGKLLCEDEYAYDVVLRLARHLISNGALVHLIVKDADDGIRDNYYLDVDHDETVNGKKIPLQQISRLSQRTLYINKLYKKYKSKGYKKQYAIMIHIDSRSVKKEIDVFFYHNERSTVGKKIAI